jgi:hypothetical protein
MHYRRIIHGLRISQADRSVTAARCAERAKEHTTDHQLDTAKFEGKPSSPSPTRRASSRRRSATRNLVGMTKFFRTTCFRQIGGFTRELMWDGIDGHRCRQLG